MTLTIEIDGFLLTYSCFLVSVSALAGKPQKRGTLGRGTPTKRRRSAEERAREYKNRLRRKAAAVARANRQRRSGELWRSR